MKIRGAILAMLAAGCATTAAVTPPPPGPDVYRCVSASGEARFLRVTPSSFHVWRSEIWGENSCETPGHSCTVDASGKISVRQFVEMENMPRVDMLFVYDLAAGTEVQSATFNGKSTTPSLARCALLAAQP